MGKKWEHIKQIVKEYLVAAGVGMIVTGMFLSVFYCGDLLLTAIFRLFTGE